MTTRAAFSNLTNNAIRPSLANKRMTRATTLVSMAMKNAPKAQGKENIVAGLKDISKPKVAIRPTRIAARRLSNVKIVEIHEDEPMELEAIATESQSGRYEL